MIKNFDTHAILTCKSCGKKFEGYKEQESLCITCFDKQLKDEPLKTEKLPHKSKIYKSWTPFYVPKLKEEGKWEDLRISIPGNSETWYRVQKTTDFIGIAIHHTAGPSSQTPDTIANYHVNIRHWGGIGYHFLIKPNGTVCYVGDVKTQRAHVANLNHKYIGVCMIGDFTNEPPTNEQLRSVYLLNKELVDVDGRFNMTWGEVKRHNQLCATACPGATWPTWWEKVLKDGKTCLELDKDIPTEIEGKFDLKSYNWYNKYWTGEEFIKTVTEDYDSCLQDLEISEENYQKEKTRASSAEKEVATRDRAIEKLKTQVKTVETERDNFRDQVKKEVNKLVIERERWNGEKKSLNTELVNQDITIRDLRKELKLLSYLKDSAAYKIGQFIVDLVKSMRGGDKK